MTNLVTNSFGIEWSDDVKHAFQQEGSRLLECVRVVHNVQGESHKFHKLAAITANTKARNADVTGIDPQHTVVTATLADFYAPIYLDKLDMQKIAGNADMRREYVKAGSNACNRKVDGIVVAALDAGSPTAIATTTGAFTYDKMLQGQQKLNDVDASWGDRFLLVGPRQVKDMFGFAEIKSRDYDALHNVQNGKVDVFMGMKVIMSNQLTLSSTLRRCYVISKEAFGLAFGNDVETSIDWIPEKVSYLVNTMMSAGAVTIEATGTIQILSDEA